MGWPMQRGAHIQVLLALVLFRFVNVVVLVLVVVVVVGVVFVVFVGTVVIPIIIKNIVVVIIIVDVFDLIIDVFITIISMTTTTITIFPIIFNIIIIILFIFIVIFIAQRVLVKAIFGIRAAATSRVALIGALGGTHESLATRVEKVGVVLEDLLQVGAVAENDSPVQKDLLVSGFRRRREGIRILLRPCFLCPFDVLCR